MDSRFLVFTHPRGDIIRYFFSSIKSIDELRTIHIKTPIHVHTVVAKCLQIVRRYPRITGIIAHCKSFGLLCTERMFAIRAKRGTSRTGFEPVRGNPIGFRVQRLNLSATVTIDGNTWTILPIYQNIVLEQRKFLNVHIHINYLASSSGALDNLKN